MIKISEIPLFTFFTFFVCYSVIGDRNSLVWSGLYFCSQYGLIFETARKYAPKHIKIAAYTLTIPSTIYVIAYYFLGIDLGETIKIWVFYLVLLTLFLFVHGTYWKGFNIRIQRIVNFFSNRNNG